jgi:outer membrane protein
MRTATTALLAALAVAAPALAAPGVLTLEEALRLARERQPTLRQARAITLAASSRADEAKSGLLPQVVGTLGYQRTTANFVARPGVVPGNGPAGGGGTWFFYNFFNTGLAVNQLIYDFGQTSGRWRAQQANAAATEQSERATLLQITLNVRGNYFDARANKELTKVARETLDNQRKHLEQIEAFVKAGTRPDIDLFQARTDTANAEVAVIAAENAYEVSKATLNQAIGSEAPVDFDVSDEPMPPVEGEDAAPDQLFQQALAARPEVASLQDSLRAAQLTVRSFEGAYGPAIGASAGLTQGGQALDRLTWNASVGLSLTWPIYQGGLTKAQVREAEANVVAVEAQIEGLRQSVRVEVEQVRLSLRAAKAAVGAAREALQNARERLALAEGRYQLGIGSIIELGDAQVALTSAAAQLVQADFRVATARAQLIKALGRP